MEGKAIKREVMRTVSNRTIISRTYYDINVEMTSPTNVGGGRTVNTDADVLRNRRGEVFIPGSSLAGAFRNFIGDELDKASVFGFSSDEKGTMSSLMISDLYFIPETVKVSIRDRVSLDDTKIVDNKFDLEVLEAGARGTIHIETIHRESMEDPSEYIDSIILALNEGDIRLGAVKNRGFGRVRVIDIRQKVFKRDDREEWIKYLSGDEETQGSAVAFDDWKEDRNFEPKFEKHTQTLRLQGGISIRKYSAEPGKPDYEHITSNGEPVIPGTSWNGAIRSGAKKILRDLGLKAEDAEKLLQDWFGKKREKEDDRSKNNASWQSRIVFAESVIKGSKMLPMTRNNINRFTAGAKSSALYTELTCIGGETELEYMVRKDKYQLAIEGMMKLVVKDLCMGFVPVGGLTAVGRGVFAGECEEISADDECIKKLYEEVRRYTR